MDFCLVGEKGKKGTYNLKQKQLDARFKKERNEDSHTVKRIKEYDESKIKLMIEMIKRLISRKIHFDYILADSWFACAEVIKFVTSRHVKCHYLGMIKMGKTKYRYNRKDYTAKALVALFDHPKKGRKFSRNLGCYYVTVDVEFAGRKVRLFFTKRNKKSEWNALITTNTELVFKEAYCIYSMRWSLEVVFKDSKGNLGLGKYQILFREVTRNSAELTITERIWGIHDGVLAFGMVSWVRCDEFPVHVDFHERACVGHVGLFGDMLVRHAVVVLVASEVYAAVGGHLEARVGDYLKVRCRQRPQVGAVDGKEALLAGVRVLLHALLVVCLRILSVAAAFSSSME